MWRRFALLRLNLPLASFLKRFAAPLLVLSFGMVLPFSDIAPGAPCGRLWGPDNYLSFIVFERHSRAAQYGGLLSLLLRLAVHRCCFSRRFSRSLGLGRCLL